MKIHIAGDIHYPLLCIFMRINLIMQILTLLPACITSPSLGEVPAKRTGFRTPDDGQQMAAMPWHRPWVPSSKGCATKASGAIDSCTRWSPAPAGAAAESMPCKHRATITTKPRSIVKTSHATLATATHRFTRTEVFLRCRQQIASSSVLP